MSGMKITGGKGVHFSFENGITISIQIGRGNYCENYDFESYVIDDKNPLPESYNAEIAVWASEGGMVDIDGDCVKGYVPFDHVMRFAEFLRSLPSDLTRDEVELSFKGFDWKGV